MILAWLTSGIHAAVITVERTRVEELAESGKRRAQILLRLLDNPFRSLTPVQFIFGASLIGFAVALTWNAFETNLDLLSRLGEIAAVLAVLIIGKLVIDFLAISRALAISLSLATPLSWLCAIAAPFLNLTDWLTRQAKGPRPRNRPTDRISPDDIQIVMSEGEDARKIELIDPDEREMIAGIIEMGQRYASEIMVPRPDVVALEGTASIDDALEVAIKYGHSRFPVFAEDMDHIIGILHVKDLLQAMRHPQQPATLRDMLRPVHYVPETAHADDILRDLLRNRVHMVVVVDEYGGTSGVLTIEDVIEEIVGEIRDEYDEAEQVPFTRISENEAVFDGSISLSEFNDEFQGELPTGESDTLGGLIYTQLGRLPRVGDKVRIGNVELTVEGLNGRRIKQVRAARLPAEPLTVKPDDSENQPQ